MNTTVYIATTLDGFIARENGDLDWLEHDAGGDDYGWGEFIASVDILVMGRKTFEKILSFEGEWPYEVPVVVMTTKALVVPQHLAARVERSSKSPAGLLEELASRGFASAYVDGGRVVQSFLAAGLIRRLIVTRFPLLIGQGIPLFGGLAADIALEHVETRAFPSGIVQSTYAIPGA